MALLAGDETLLQVLSHLPVRDGAVASAGSLGCLPTCGAAHAAAGCGEIGDAQRNDAQRWGRMEQGYGVS